MAVVNGQLIIDGTPAFTLIQKYGTPLYIFLEQRIRDNCRTFLKLAQKYFKSQIYYSYKANYLTPICKIIVEEGLGAEISTEYEYNVALETHLSPSSIILSAPYKPPSLLQKVISKHIGLILIWQVDEIPEIAQYIEADQIQPIGIRIRSPLPNKQIGFSTDEPTIRELSDLIGKTEKLSLSTLQLHVGTQFDNQIFKEGIEHLLNTANQLEQHGITISQLDFGGGFPEASMLSEAELDNLFLLLYNILHDRGWENISCLFEPGRYIVGDAGLLLTQIIRTFSVDQHPWIMLNTGLHHCPRFSNSKFRFEIIHRMADPHDTPTSIAGCLPTDMDVFAKYYSLVKDTQKGDYLAIFNAGAYTLSWSTRFSYPYPLILFINKAEDSPFVISEVK